MSRMLGSTLVVVFALGLVSYIVFMPKNAPDETGQSDYPSKDITLIVGYAPGGGTDVMARTVARFMEKHLGHRVAVIVKNVPGAGGQIGYTRTAHADADGYTLGTISLPGTLARTIDRKADYSIDSFTYLANFINDPNVIIASTDSGILDIETMLERAKGAVGALTVGLATVGGEDHFSIMGFSELTGTEFNYIPFKGSAQVRTALMGGHIDLSVLNVSEVAGFKDEFTILAVLANKRADAFPSVPTTIELGLDIQSSSRRGIVAPAGLPAEVTDKLLSVFEAVYQDPEFKRILADQGNPIDLVLGKSYEQLAKSQLESAQQLWDAAPWR